MKHVVRNVFAVLVLILQITSSSQAKAEKKKPWRGSETKQADTVDQSATAMTVWQARRAVIAGLKIVLPRAYTHKSFFSITGYTVQMNAASVRVNGGHIDCEANVADWNGKTGDENPRVESCKVDLSSIGRLDVERLSDSYWLTENGDRDEDGVLGHIAWETEEDAQAFADAVNRLHAAALGQDRELLEADWPDFQKKAAAWRALADKPAISEVVRKHRLLAENAVKENHFDSAVEEYEAGLKINPVWPEGHFNAALLCAEMGYYSEAINHLRAYLELTPDAPDAQQARDQVVIWEGKMSALHSNVPDSKSVSDQKPASRWGKKSKTGK